MTMLSLAGAGACGVGCGMLLQETVREWRVERNVSRISVGSMSSNEEDDGSIRQVRNVYRKFSNCFLGAAKHVSFRPPANTVAPVRRQSEQIENFDDQHVPMRQTLRSAWDKLGGNGDDEITEEDFVKSCMENLHFDLSEDELVRIFKSADVDGNKSLSQSEFMQAVAGKAFFQNLVQLSITECDFQISIDYDFELCTNDNYKSTEIVHTGEFADVRATLDYSYHVCYTPERQAWQDSVIKQVAIRTKAQQSPWCIFTCGPMGAGKGYALSWMSKNGYFPIEGMVHIDPDYFKNRMPEFQGYRERQKEAGSMCHRESAFMQEIGQEAAMRRRQHVWIDGSLKDANWFGEVFDGIRKRYPHYRIAIFYVWASPDTVRQRCADRARITGRAIPEELMMASLQEPKESLSVLIPKADFIARIDNNSATPVLEAVEEIDRSGCWTVIQKRFAVPDIQAHEFPNYLKALHLQSVPRELCRCVDLKSKRYDTGKKCRFSLELGLLDYDVRIAWLESCRTTSFTLEGSSIHAVPYSPSTRHARGICDEAVTRAWIYECPNRHASENVGGLGLTSWKSTKMRSSKAEPPSLNWTSWKSQNMQSIALMATASDGSVSESPSWSPVFTDDSADVLRGSYGWQSEKNEGCRADSSTAADVIEADQPTVYFITNLLLGGGFVYFDSHGDVVQLQVHALNDTQRASRIQFAQSVDMSCEVVSELKKKSRWMCPNIDFFLKRGVVGYTWCIPGEVIAAHVIPPNGAFAFLFGSRHARNERAIYFPVLD